MVEAMGFPFFMGLWGPGGLCDVHRSEQVFYSLHEQVFGVKEFFEQAFSEQMFDLRGEHLYAFPYV